MRSVTWSVVDASMANTTASTTLDTVHKAPVVVAGATVTYTEGQSPPATARGDSGVTVTDLDTIASATVSISSGMLSTDKLDFKRPQ